VGFVVPTAREITGIQLVPSIFPEPEEIPSASEQIGAGFQLENPLVNLDRAVAQTVENALIGIRPEEGFDPFDHLEPGEEIVADRFSDVTSRAGMEQRRAQIIRESELKRALATGPLNPIIASLPAVVADPTNYLPLLGQVRGASALARAAFLGATTASQVAVSEAVLQATQATRMAEQSIAAVILGWGFGAALGGAAGALANRAARQSAIADAALAIEAGRTGDTAGAARYVPIRPEDTLPAASARIGELASRLPSWLRAPAVDLAYSDLPFARELGIRLTDSGIINEGVLRDTANPQALSIRIKTYDRYHAVTDAALKQTYREHKKAGGGLSRTDFRIAVGQAMRRGDISSDAAVTKAAKVLRADVIEPLAAEAQRLGLLPAELSPTTAVSYFTRIYNRQAMKANQAEFERIVAQWFVRTGQAEGPDEAAVMARDVFHNILGGPSGRTAIGIPAGKRGPLAEKTFFIPDEQIEPFLISDPVEVLPRYVNTMARELEFSKSFGDLGGGVFPIEAIAQRMRDQAAEMGAQLTDAVARRKLSDEADRLVAVVEGLMHQLRGTAGRGAADPSSSAVGQGLAIARNWNFMRLLGAVTLSSIPDLGLTVMRAGFTRALTRFIPAFLTGMRQSGLGRKQANTLGALRSNGAWPTVGPR
jgi:hypothetical protein